jgi:hypothetical protein
MSARLEALAREKEILVMRSALCRLRLRRERLAIRASLPWKYTLPARVLVLATRALLVVKVARVAIGFVRGRARPAVCGIEQTAS